MLFPGSGISTFLSEISHVRRYFQLLVAYSWYLLAENIFSLLAAILWTLKQRIISACDKKLLTSAHSIISNETPRGNGSFSYRGSEFLPSRNRRYLPSYGSRFLHVLKSKVFKYLRSTNTIRFHQDCFFLLFRQHDILNSLVVLL